MMEENNKKVVSNELDEKEVKVEKEEISDKELNDVSGGIRKKKKKDNICYVKFF